MIFLKKFFRKKRGQIEVFKSTKGLFEDSQFTRDQTKIKPKKKRKKKVKLKSTWRIKFIIHRVYRAFHEFSLFS